MTLSSSRPPDSSRLDGRYQESAVVSAGRCGGTLAGLGPVVATSRVTDWHLLPWNRFVLAVGSAVFDAMFNGGMATTSTEIELPDVEPAAFLALLK